MKRIIPWSRIKNNLKTNWSLSELEVNERLRRFGPNEIKAINHHPLLELLKNTLEDSMIWFLVGTGCLFLILKEYHEAYILFGAIIPIMSMDAFLHWRTQTSTEKLHGQLHTQTTVLREGQEKKIKITHLVPGDLVFLKAGDFVPADGLILEAQNVQIDEAVLTGESLPMSKKSLLLLNDVAKNDPIDEAYCAFAGTKILTGHMKLRVIYTGIESLYGEILNAAIETKKAQTPLQRSIAKLVNILILISTSLCLILALTRYLQGFGLIDALISASTLAVAALPDEFPIVFTLFLGVGVYRLAQKNALVRHAVCVENLGRITFICTDKTGTMTEGHFKIAKYEPIEECTEKAFLTYLSQASRQESGDLLDFAILEAAQEAKIDLHPPIHSFPFTEARKRETSIYETQGQWIVVMKGAPETIFENVNLSSEDLIYWQNRVTELANLAYKVLGLCIQKIAPQTEIKEPQGQYTFLGLVAFKDPIRQGVKEAVEACLKDNIHVLMITGDHPKTALAIAREIGLSKDPILMLADKMPAAHLQDFRGLDIIARAIPMQKYEIVKALQAQGEIVAVTGDGINDVPALKASDIGLAMGEHGTQSAREVADIILLDDNFKNISSAITEGKTLFENLKKCFKYLLLIHAPFVFSAAIVPFLGYPLLFEPIDIVFIELIIHPTALLVFQDLPLSQHTTRPSSSKHIHFFNRQEGTNLICVSFISTSIILAVFFFNFNDGPPPLFARSLGMGILSFMSVAFAIKMGALKSKRSAWILIVIIGLILGVFLSPLSHQLFNFVTLSLKSWLLILAIALGIGLITKA